VRVTLTPGSGREERAQTKVGRDNSMVENLFTHRRNHDGYNPIPDPRGTRLRSWCHWGVVKEPCQAIRSGLNAYDGNGPSRTEQSLRLKGLKGEESVRSAESALISRRQGANRLLLTQVVENSRTAAPPRQVCRHVPLH
jgi:hypothetical protein